MKKPTGDLKEFLELGQEFKLQLGRNGHKVKRPRYYKKMLRKIRRGF